MYSIVIQAGGKSSRMGRDKSFISLAGKPMIERVFDQIASVGDEIIITTNQDKKYKKFPFRIVSDQFTDYGALSGLQAGLKAAKNELVFVVANDMPFLNLMLFNYMKTLLNPGVDVVIPYHSDGYEPFHALYRRSTCLPAIEEAIKNQSKRIISWFSKVNVVTVDERMIAQLDPGKLSFFNVNTPENLIEAEKIILKRGSDH